MNLLSLFYQHLYNPGPWKSQKKFKRKKKSTCILQPFVGLLCDRCQSRGLVYKMTTAMTIWDQGTSNHKNKACQHSIGMKNQSWGLETRECRPQQPRGLSSNGGGSSLDSSGYAAVPEHSETEPPQRTLYLREYRSRGCLWREKEIYYHNYWLRSSQAYQGHVCDYGCHQFWGWV